MNNQHLLFIGYVWPEPNSSAAGSRTMQLIELFQNQGWKITFASAASNSEYMVDLNSMHVDRAPIELNNSSFDEFIKKLQPSIVLFDRFIMEEQYGWRVLENCPHALRILDTSDLWCLRLARQQAVKENRKFSLDDLNSEVAKREIASILRCDISIIIAEFEMNLLQTHFKIDPTLLYYLPFLLDSINQKEVDTWPSFESRKHFMTIGNFLHEPNWDSVKHLKKEIWPLIRKKLPQAEMHVYGAYDSPKVNELNNPKEGFYIKGRANNLKSVFQQARICLAPLRFGAGMKGKLIDAMYYGTPSITTDIGAESMHGDLPWNGVIANDSEAFAQAAIQLHEDKLAWVQAQENGIAIINSRYSKRAGAGLINHILNTQNSIEQHRSKNFTGAMLIYHTLSSRKYLSLWIEAKNASN